MLALIYSCLSCPNFCYLYVTELRFHSLDLGSSVKHACKVLPFVVRSKIAAVHPYLHLFGNTYIKLILLSVLRHPGPEAFLQKFGLDCFKSIVMLLATLKQRTLFTGCDCVVIKKCQAISVDNKKFSKKES